jgi:Family of unknown function (DUF6519)
MKGDFTRGSEPDRKRGKRYRRVLVQQSRVLLDSDAAALVDSIDHELRGITAGLGGRLGSPDLGYLITPGRLLALFEHAGGVVASAPATAARDYRRKYPEEPEGRYPSLRIDGIAAGSPPGSPGTVKIPLVEPLTGPFDGQLAIWYRADAAVSIKVTAGAATTPLALPAATSWTRRTAAVSVAGGTALRDLSITGDPGAPVWIALVELHEDRDEGPHFWVAAGRYHAAGLTPALSAATGYPEVSYPPRAGFPTSEPMFGLATPQPPIVAYLETWERDVTAAEDPGLREVALGKVDTTVRTEVIGQIKWAVAGGLTPAELRGAFRSIAPSTSELVVSAPTTPPSSDPCALPTSGGYTGADHRLYRFEVHAAGGPTTARLKWSRDNAAHVFTVRELTTSRVTLDRDCGLVAGDLVEVLSEVVDLGDAGLATVTAAGVTPAARRVGMLARLKQEESDSQGRDVFSLRDPANPVLGVDPATDPVRYPTVNGERVPLRLRRWDGVVTPEVSGTDVVARIEDGIELRLAGTFRPGEYWQYEARRGASNDNGPWRARPHGPERILAPLALLDMTGAPSEPLRLRAWLDDRSSPLCELDADDIEFDGERIGTGADTVQEAIEELYEREGGNCSDASLSPSGLVDDDAVRITAAINAATFPSGGHLSLDSGIYDIRSPIVIDKDVVIRGCPDAMLLAHGNVPIFEVRSRGQLRIEQLTLFNGPIGTSARLVELHEGGRLAAREVGFLGAGSAAAIAAPGASAIEPDINAGDDPVVDPINLPPRTDLPSQIDLQDCVVIATAGVIGEHLLSLTATRTAFVFSVGGISAARIHEVLITDCSFRDGLFSGFFDWVQPELLRAQTDELFATTTGLPDGDGCAIAVTELLGGSLARNRQRCMVGIWCRVARALSIVNDELQRPPIPAIQSRAIRIHHAHRVDIEGGRYTATFPIVVPLSAQRVTVRNCQIVAESIGIAFAGEDRELFNASSIVGVSIEGNHVTTTGYGIAIGANGTRAQTVDDVRIAGNVVRRAGDDDATAAILAGGDSSSTTAIVVEGNDVTADHVGIELFGAGGVVRGNQVRLTTNGEAIVGRLGAPVPLGQVTVVDNVITGPGSYYAIGLYGTPDARVTGNQVRKLTPTATPYALYLTGATSSLSHHVVGNDFSAGRVIIQNTHNLHLVGNTILYVKVDSGTSGQNGMVHGNQLGTLNGYSADLSGVRGMWKISDNLAQGIIRVIGSTNQSLTRWPDLLADAAPLARLLPFVTREPVDAGTVLASIRAAAEHELLDPVRDFLSENNVFADPRPTPASDPFDFHISGNRCGELIAGLPTLGYAMSSTSSLHAVDNKVDAKLEVTMVYDATNLHNVVALNSAQTYAPSTLITHYTGFGAYNLRPTTITIP